MLEDILWGLWNGITAWPLLILHLFDIWERFPVYNIARDGGWYQFGFLLGAGSPLLGAFGKKQATNSQTWRSRRNAMRNRELTEHG